MIKRTLTSSTFCFFLIITAASSGQTPTTDDGVFSVSQAEAGKAAYTASCAGCHDSKFYRDIWPYWQGKRLIDFFWRVVAEMPSDNPGSLSDDEYTTIVAYILSELGYPPGEAQLNPQTDMENIIISSQ